MTATTGVFLLGVVALTWTVLVFLLLACRSALLRTPPDPAAFSHTRLHAERILCEINTRSHRFFERDADYNEALFRRYAFFLWLDMKRLIGVGSFVGVFYLLLFCLWYGVLSVPWGYRTFGTQGRGLSILIASLMPAARLAKLPQG